MERMVTVVTTVDRKQVLEELGRALLEKRLIACIQIVGPIKSIYRWKGVIEEAEEYVGIMKTRSSLYDRVEKEVRQGHPYEVPEIVCLEIERVLSEYRQWLHAETAPPLDSRASRD